MPTCFVLHREIISEEIAVVSPPDPRGKLACDLGKFILDQLPYGAMVSFPPPLGAASTSAVVAIPDSYGTDAEIDKGGLYAQNTAAAPFQMYPVITQEGLVAAVKQFDATLLDKIEHWTIGGASHQVTRSIRIWYTYTIPAATVEGKAYPERTVGAWLVIGYVGNGH